MITVSSIQIPALPTERPRRLYVYTPDGYETDERRYPVLYMFDGHNVFFDADATYGKSWGMKEYLEAHRTPLILVAFECNPEGVRRLFEYSPWDFSVPRRFYADGLVKGLGKVTMDWLVNELKPMIDRTYRTLPDREHTLIAGSSMGGLMTIYALTAYNDTFAKGAALSPCLWDNPSKLAKLLKTLLLSPTMLYMDYGEAEDDGDRRPHAAMFRTAAAFTKAGGSVAARSVPNAQHSEAYWEQRIPIFMDYLLG